ncbi:prophage Lp1 protein 31 [Kingella kingae ATCC 23330]|uniref:Prophage Lp1 protein 31 n=1 Tax=Kingella kingae ATCC 23330 TaxID=887327 RepID=F5S4R5_KINKI|nr:prophage Lp1 protein 31 [Kingella kingae ATCC 23330]
MYLKQPAIFKNALYYRQNCTHRSAYFPRQHASSYQTENVLIF